MDDMKEMVMDTYSPESVTMLQLLLSELERESRKKHEDVINLLENWDGKYERTSSAPLLYNHWIWNTLKLSMSDELGDTLFYQFMNTHFMKTSVSKFLKNEDSNWWDDINTEVKESRKSVINASFNLTINELEAKLGKEPRNWQWGKVHKLELKHPLGAVKPLNLLFNLGPIEISGGNEVLNNQGFHLNSELNYKVVFGPAMRRIIDFSALEQTISVLPGGQSGHLGSRFYGDQFKMYVNGSFRLQEFSPENIRSSYSQKLVLYP
jgi:penicillin amidase